jgi:HEAT repeat protein
LPHAPAGQHDPQLVVEVVRLLGRIGDSSATVHIRTFLASPDENVRAAAALALGEIGDERVEEDIKEKLRDRSPEVVNAAKRALEARRVSNQIVRPVMKFVQPRYSRRSPFDRARMRMDLRSVEVDDVCAAAIGLALSGDKQSWRAIATRLDAATPRIRMCAAKSLSALANPEAASLLGAYARVEEDPMVQRAILDAAVASLAGMPRPLWIR